MKVWMFVNLVVAIYAGYHEEVGIPLATRIKAFEDKKVAEGRGMTYRAVGSEVDPENAHPYMAGLIIRLETEFMSMCGSSLVTATRLVTAAHCVEKAKSIKAVLGSQYLFHGGIRIITKDFAAHPQFNATITLDYDIGVVKLPQPVEVSSTVSPINIPKTPEEAEQVGEWAVAAGWGLTEDADRGKQRDENLMLNQVRLQIVDEMMCKKEYKSYGKVQYMVLGNAICTTGEGGVGTCDGDSGGPLVVDRNGTKLLVGVISFVTVPCQIFYPSLFTRVLKYTEFILNS